MLSHCILESVCLHAIDYMHPVIVGGDFYYREEAVCARQVEASSLQQSCSCELVPALLWGRLLGTIQPSVTLYANRDPDAADDYIWNGHLQCYHRDKIVY